jgi:Protein of unknown function (DUF3500)
MGRADDAIRVATRAASMAKTPEERAAVSAALAGAQEFQVSQKKMKEDKPSGESDAVKAPPQGNKFPVQPGQPHYYRIQGPTFVVEYDNTQDNTNHIHTVWRDFDHDFGLDPLRAHYLTSPHHRHLALNHFLPSAPLRSELIVGHRN